MNEPSLAGYLITLVILLAFSAFFSTCETALISLSRYHLKKLKKRDKRAGRLEFWFHNTHKVLITILVANNVVNIAASVLVAALSYQFFHRVMVALLTGILTFVIIIFGEIIPKSLGKKFAERIALFAILPMRFFCIILTPVTKLLLFISSGLVRIFGVKLGSILPILTEEDLKAMISAGEEEGVIEEEEREMLHSIFEIGNMVVREIMVPRVNMVAVEENNSLAEILKTVVQKGYSRLPVYRDNFDKTVGVVYIKDVLARMQEETGAASGLKAKDVMRPLYFVPETKKVQELLEELREKQMQMALVVDEYGGTAGLVTMEDLVEEIVGEISDEYKKDVSDFQKLPDGSYLVAGSMEIEKANAELGLNIPKGEVETVAGFILENLGRFPQKGERLKWDNVQFSIQEADSKTIRWIKLKKLVEAKEEPHEPGRNIPAETAET